MQQIEIRPAPLEMLGMLLDPARNGRLLTTAVEASDLLRGRVVWNVNATAQGGGVAEMLQGLLAYGRGAGVDTRWLVLDGDAEFFAITKRIHNAIHGSWEPGTQLGPAEHAHFDQVLQGNLSTMQELLRPGDIVLLHDPQTAGLVDGVRAAGAHVIWRCHIGRDDSNDATDLGWAFLRGYLENAESFVFSRKSYVPDWVPSEQVRIIAPSIDPSSLKNRELDPVQVDALLGRVGLVAGGDGIEAIPFVRRDGTPGAVRRHDQLLGGSPPPPLGAPLILQVSRWDHLKDMSGVLSAFASGVAGAVPEAHLMLAGPDVSGVTDDPEGAAVLAECRAQWADLPDSVRDRCHLACIPMDDVDENAIIVNALQRHATIVAQKSLFEGFGLTVSEAMWKSRPVVASAVGGIMDQIDDGVDGLLLPDPTDLAGFAQRLERLLGDRALGTKIGMAARERVRNEFLGDRHLIQYVDLFHELIGA